MTFRPLQDRVVVCRIEDPSKTAGGKIIPDTAQEKPVQGEVLSIGPGGRDEKGSPVAISVEAGHRFPFAMWSDTEAKVDGMDLLMMKESDIFGVVEGKTPIRAAG
jgi:chaperonin GroES